MPYSFILEKPGKFIQGNNKPLHDIDRRAFHDICTASELAGFAWQRAFDNVCEGLDEMIVKYLSQCVNDAMWPRHRVYPSSDKGLYDDGIRSLF